MLLLYLYFNILLLLSYFLYLLYTVNQFSFTHFRYCVSTFSYKHMPQCKFSLYLKKGGLASRNTVHFLKKVILRCIGLCFNYHHYGIVWLSIGAMFIHLPNDPTMPYSGQSSRSIWRRIYLKIQNQYPVLKVLLQQ